VEKIALQKNVLEAVLRAIPMKRKFAKSYNITRNLVQNPRTPLDLSLTLMKNLMVHDLKNLSTNKEVSDTIRKVALRMFRQKNEKKGWKGGLALERSDAIYELLSRAKTIAVVGLSDSPMRPSHGVSAYIQAAGYRIIPVNPRIGEELGEGSYPSLLDVPSEIAKKIDLVDVFRRPQYVDEIVEQAIQLKIPAVWLQEDVVNERAAEKARKAGILVVMDRCILKEHRARFG